MIVDRDFVWRRIEHAFAGWEAALESHGSRSELERVWYGRLDEAAAVGIESGLLTPEDVAMLEDRVVLRDPNCSPESGFGLT